VKIVYVTAALPYGPDEAFIVPEIHALMRAGHEVLIAPRSPRGKILHGRELVEHARLESLVSTRVLRAAACEAFASPARTARALGVAAGSKIIKNLAIVPKALWLAAIAREWRAEHIHCHWAGTTASAAMVASAVSGIPWSFTLHRWDIVENNLLAAKVRHATFARFISEDGLRMARERGVPVSEKTRVIHMGVAVPRETARTRRQGVVLCPARLVDVKGHAVLLEAWRLLKSRGVARELWLAGDGELREKLKATASETGIGDSVKFLGALPHGELLSLYEQGLVSAVAMASVDLGRGCHEGIPVGLMEAMGYGIPVIATRAGGTPELITPDAGVLVAPGDAEALAGAIGQVTGDPEFAARLGRAGRRRVLEKFEIARVVAELTRAFGVAETNLVANAE
jgi:colanic acid/amylovoran biosynthesis glycosyltransferase